MEGKSLERAFGEYVLNRNLYNPTDCERKLLHLCQTYGTEAVAALWVEYFG